MNILIFNQYFWPENFRINEIAFALKAQGHEVEDFIKVTPQIKLHPKFGKAFQYTECLF
jgi:hypothetical protein